MDEESRSGSGGSLNGLGSIAASDLNAFDAAGTGCSGTPKTCAPLWTSGSVGFVTASPAVANGLVYFGTFTTFAGVTLTGYNAAGSPVWTSAAIVAGAPWNSSPAVANGVVYVGGTEDNTGSGSQVHKNLYAFNTTTGAQLWSAPTGGQVLSSSAVANGVVYVGSDDDNHYAFNATSGAKLWSSTTAGGVDSSPAVANGMVYVGSNDGKLYAFGLP